MITTREVDPCEFKTARDKHQGTRACVDSANYNSSQVDAESRKELIRRGAVGRRRAVVALPADVLSAIAEIAELKW